MKQTLTHKYGKAIVVTQIEQFCVPAYMHGNDIRDAIVFADGWWQIDFHGFKMAMSGQGVRDEIFGKALEYFRGFGVNVEGGTYIHIGWVEVAEHRAPMHHETVLVVCPQGTITAAWDAKEKEFSRDGYLVEGVTHWQRLPASPQYEKDNV